MRFLTYPILFSCFFLLTSSAFICSHNNSKEAIKQKTKRIFIKSGIPLKGVIFQDNFGNIVEKSDISGSIYSSGYPGGGCTKFYTLGFKLDKKLNYQWISITSESLPGFNRTINSFTNTKTIGVEYKLESAQRGKIAIVKNQYGGEKSQCILEEDKWKYSPVTQNTKEPDLEEGALNLAEGLGLIDRNNSTTEDVEIRNNYSSSTNDSQYTIVTTTSNRKYYLSNAQLVECIGLAQDRRPIRSKLHVVTNETASTIPLNDIRSIQIRSSRGSGVYIQLTALIDLKNGSNITGEFMLCYVEGIDSDTGISMKVLARELKFIQFP